MINVNGSERSDVTVIAVCKKWNTEFAILKNGKGELGIFIRYGCSAYALTSAWADWNKDFVYLKQG